MDNSQEKAFQATKQAFLNVYADKMKKAGVVFKVGDSTCKSQEMYWNLFKLNITTLISAMAAAGEKGLSLSGILSGNFSEVGKDPERRYVRPKFKISSKFGDVYKNNRDLVHTDTDSIEAFQQFFQENFEVLGGEAIIESYHRAVVDPQGEVEEVLEV